MPTNEDNNKAIKRGNNNLTSFPTYRHMQVGKKPTTMTILETNRLQLQEATLNDGAFFLKLLNSPSWIANIGDRGIKTEEEAQGYIQKVLIDSYRKNGYGLYKIVLKSENQPIGLCGLVKREGLEHTDIGFALLPAYEQKGYAYEAASATMEYAKSALQLKKIVAITLATNLPSRRLLEKIGLQFEKHIRLPNDDTELCYYG